jgi:solute carrier family 25 (mitochondrial carnitine/acylcarnitine transporter), member 20/29
VTFVGHPFDTIKVRLQTQPSVNPIYGGFIDCARKTVQWEGFAGLYKGVTSPLAGQMFFRASLFSAFGSSKRYLATNPDGTQRALTTRDVFLAGAVTGAAIAFTESPIDFFKSQLQIQIIRSKMDPNYKPPFSSLVGCVKGVVAENGFLGAYQGFAATLTRNIPANCVYLGSFEVFKREAAQRLDVAPAKLPSLYTFMCGATAGVIYWVSTYPVDVVKSALMTDALKKSERKYAGFGDAVGKLWAEGGVKRFFRGFTPCVIRAVPANGVMLLTVDLIGGVLDRSFGLVPQ